MAALGWLQNLALGGADAASATVTGSFTEAQIVAGGEQIVITLANDTWLAAGTGPIGSTANTQAIIDGVTSAQSEPLGWNTVVRDNEPTASVVRTSNTVVTITWSAAATYDITADETITATVPGAALTGASPITGSPTVSITATAVSRAAGRWKKRRRYVVEIDGELFEVRNQAEAQVLLEQVREVAEEAVEKDVPIKPVKIKVRTGTGKESRNSNILSMVRSTRLAVDSAIEQQTIRWERTKAVNLEIAELLQRKIEQEDQDEEDALIALLLV